MTGIGLHKTNMSQDEENKTRYVRKNKLTREKKEEVGGFDVLP